MRVLVELPAGNLGTVPVRLSDGKFSGFMLQLLQLMTSVPSLSY